MKLFIFLMSALLLLIALAVTFEPYMRQLFALACSIGSGCTWSL